MTTGDVRVELRNDGTSLAVLAGLLAGIRVRRHSGGLIGIDRRLRRGVGLATGGNGPHGCTRPGLAGGSRIARFALERSSPR
jgi:hypothetical protein